MAKQLTIDTGECAHKGKRLSCPCLGMFACYRCGDCGKHVIGQPFPSAMNCNINISN